MSKFPVSAAALCLAAAMTVPAAGGQRAGQAPPTRFRTGVDLIAVDVQVIARDGRPAADLAPDTFQVTIDGRRRRVVTAELIRTDTAPALGAAAAAPAGPKPPARVIVLAIDCLSFRPVASRTVLEAARRFVGRTAPSDLVGLIAYPIGPKIDPTTDHAAIARALGTVIGQAEGDTSQFHLRPSEIIDLNAALTSGTEGSSRAFETVVVRECGNPPDESCRARLRAELTGTALYYEGQAHVSIGMLRSLLKDMSSVAGRKTVVLVSGGMIASDTPGGRPDIREIGIEAGKEAARANAAVYTLYVDPTFMDRFSADAPGQRSFDNLSRDSSVLGRWLDQFSGAAGGSLFTVQTGAGDTVFDRILTELGSYYLLGVEAADTDRDGRTHEITVKTNQRNMTVRGRRWVTVPLRDAPAAAAPARASVPAASTAAQPAAAAAAPVPRVVPPGIQALATLFDRGDYEALQWRLRQSSDLAAILHDFRAFDTPWPDDPHRTAIFALEIAVAGLRSSDRRAVDEAGRVLAEYTTRIRAAGEPDPFECAWLETEAAAFEGAFMSNAAMVFVSKSADRCPSTPRLQLAYASISDQQWLREGSRDTGEAAVLPRYERAMTFPETEAEARMRAAWFLRRTGQVQRALAVLDGLRSPSSDQQVRYLTELVRGEILRALGRADDAEAAFRAALTAWPGAQSARVALMTLLAQRGNRAEAAALADAVETAPDDQFDPWWMYWIGGLRQYPASLQALRELAR